MSATRTPARRLAAVLLLSLVAVLVPIAGSPAADAAPAATASDDVVPAVAGPPSALPGRHAPFGPVLDDRTTPTGHPGPVLDALLLAPPDAPATGPAATAVEPTATAGLDPGHGSPADPRGPPQA